MKKQSSLRWKILKYLLAFVFAMISLIWLFQTVFLDSFYKSIKTKNLEYVASPVSYLLEDDSLQQQIDSLSTDNEVCIRVVKLDSSQFPSEKQYVSQSRGACAVARLSGEQIVDYWLKAKSSEGSYLSETVEVIPMNDPSSSQMTFKETGNQDILLARNITNDNTDALILVSTRVSPINSTIETLRVQLIGITVIICGMAVALAAFMNVKVTRPLEEINDSARMLATGNYNVKFNASGYKEINELNETMNYAVTQLNEVDQIRRDLISNVSHDLRTPLTMVEGYAEMMRDLPGENTPENAQVIIDEAHRLSLLVNDLLDLSRLQENKIELKKEKVNFSHLINEIISRYQKYLESQGFELVVDVEDDLMIEADVQRLEQILYNFINNAIQYSANQKLIEIHCHKANQIVRAEIKDHGIGIAPDKLNQIWERYYKIDRQHVRAVSGSGIGLSICKHLLQLHQANFGVISKQQEGTTFWFELPLLSNPLSTEQK